MDAFARRRVAFAGIVVVLLAMHLFPPHRGAFPMIAGFLPWDLAYAVLWMFAAAAAVLWMTHRVWRDEPPGGDGDAT